MSGSTCGCKRPVLCQFGGASDPFSADLGVHPTRVGPIRPGKIIKHPFGFAVFFENGPEHGLAGTDLEVKM